jgi:hypothetical protein
MWRRERAIFRGVGHEFEKHHHQHFGGGSGEPSVGATNGCVANAHVRRKLTVNQVSETDTLPITDA